MSEEAGVPLSYRADPERDRRVRRVLGIEGFANLCVLAAKTVVGTATGSSAVLADAVHSFADLANNGLALLALHLAGAPPDREHPYGHRKYETLAVFALATLLAVLAVEIALHALERGDRSVIRHGWSLGLMLGVLAVNIVVSVWESGCARRLDSDILRADARHTFSDVLMTVAVIIGWQLAARGYYWLDAAFTLGVAAVILVLAFGLFRRAIPVLVDRIATDPEHVTAVVQSVPGVRDTRRVRSHVSGQGMRIDVVVAVDPQLSTAASHGIADDIERTLRERFSTPDVTVHVEPES
ncbi:MAG: cation diffusion facilitator family transporter [Myxococcales bacterium]|nr:cation diffusion facilitator family transporter [Myxococcales bacterium]